MLRLSTSQEAQQSSIWGRAGTRLQGYMHLVMHACMHERG